MTTPRATLLALSLVLAAAPLGGVPSPRTIPAPASADALPLSPDAPLFTAAPPLAHAVARRGNALGLVWTSATAPHLFAATSNSAGARWSIAQTLPDAPPDLLFGNALLLRRGDLWFTYATPDGSVFLQALHAGGRPAAPTRLDLTVAPGTAPTLALERDEPAAPVVLLVQHAAGTLRVPLPEPKLTFSDDCGCDPAVVSGHALRGEIIALHRDPARIEFNHAAIPDVLVAGPRTTRLDPRLLDALAPGQRFLARLEKRPDGEWWLFDLRLLGTPR